MSPALASLLRQEEAQRQEMKKQAERRAARAKQKESAWDPLMGFSVRFWRRTLQTWPLPRSVQNYVLEQWIDVRFDRYLKLPRKARAERYVCEEWMTMFQNELLEVKAIVENLPKDQQTLEEKPDGIDTTGLKVQGNKGSADDWEDVAKDEGEEDWELI